MGKLKIIKEIIIIISGILLDFWIFFILYEANKKKNIDKDIESLIYKMDKLKLNDVTGDMEINIPNKSRAEKQKIEEIKMKLERLKRKKQYILEDVSIYKIFKK